jgi:hypothetical protein
MNNNWYSVREFTIITVRNIKSALNLHKAKTVCTYLWWDTNRRSATRLIYSLRFNVMLREDALNLSQSLKVRKTKLSFTVTENNIRKKIPMTGRVFAVGTIHTNNKIIHLCDSRSKKKVYKTHAFVIIINWLWLHQKSVSSRHHFNCFRHWSETLVTVNTKKTARLKQLWRDDWQRSTQTFDDRR